MKKKSKIKRIVEMSKEIKGLSYQEFLALILLSLPIKNKLHRIIFNELKNSGD
jgi:hypothetical protein